MSDPCCQSGEACSDPSLYALAEVDRAVGMSWIVLPAEPEVSTRGQHAVRPVLEYLAAHAGDVRLASGAQQEGDDLVGVSLLFLLHHALADDVAGEIHAGRAPVRRAIRVAAHDEVNELLQWTETRTRCDALKQCVQVA